ncbi:MAG: glycosyltransferase family 39 protein [Peptococcaceae bacterium]
MFETPFILIISSAILVLILLGLFLSRYNIKYITLSLTGLALILAYLSYTITIDLNRFDSESIILKIIAIFLFLLSSIGIVRYGIHFRSKYLHVTCSKINVSFHFKKRLSGFFKWFTYRENIIVCIIAVVVLITHLVNIDNPSYKMGDEGYYATDAAAIADGANMVLLEHPPLAKWFIAAGISVFGDNATGWRIFPIIFGIASIFIFYLLCKTLCGNFKTETKAPKWFRPEIFIPLLATFLFAFENLSFVLAHTAMLDVFYLAFMLLGFLFYLRHNYYSCGIAMGLSMLCKETALLGVIAIALHWLIVNRREILEEIKWMLPVLKQKREPELRPSRILDIFKVMVSVVITWIVMLPLLEVFNTANWNPVLRTFYIAWHNLLLSMREHGAGFWEPTDAWTWIIWQPLQNFDYEAQVQYFMAVSYSLLVLIIPGLVYLIYRACRDINNKNSVAVFTFCWIFSVYGLLAIFSLIVSRPMYLFHFYATIPALCIMVALAFWELWNVMRKRRLTAIAYYVLLAILIIATVAVFFIMSPYSKCLL